MSKAQILPKSPLSPSVSLIKGCPATTSLAIAEHFSKRHERVLDAIRRIISELSSDFTEHNFVSSEYVDASGRKLPMYQLTRDAFSLVVMGFTGKEALAWKVRYIEAFNAMEKELLKKAAPALESEEERQRRLARNRKRLQRERERKALLPAPKPYREKCAETVAEMYALRGQFSKVSENMMNTFAEPFWKATNSPIPENMKPFAHAMSFAIQSFWMTMFKELSTIEDLYRAYVEAEKVLNS